MKITIEQRDLIKALQHISKLIKANVQMPILGCVVMDIKPEVISFWASDSISVIRVDKPIRCDGEDRIAVAISSFMEYCQQLSSGDVILTINDGSVQVSQGSSKATFPLSNINDYPDVLETPKEYSLHISQDNFDLLLKHMLISVSIDDSRPILTGILLRPQSTGKMTAVGTDGYRLSVYDFEYQGDLDRDVVIPGKIVATFLKGSVIDVVDIGLDGQRNQIWLHSDDLYVGVRIIQGDFPPFERILPTSELSKVDVGRDELLQAVKQMAVFAKYNANIVRVDVGASLKLSTHASATGEGDSNLDVEFSGEKLAVAFNYRYLQDYLGIMPDGVVEIVFNGPLAPVKFVMQEIGNFVHIIMPVKLQE